MFDIISPRYDQFTRWFSFGMDSRWKTSLLRMIPHGRIPAGAVVDLASGTGDLALALQRKLPSRLVLSSDISLGMLAAASQRFRSFPPPRGTRGQNSEGAATASPSLPSLLGADMMSLPFRSGAVALLASGYGFRNVPDLRVALAESARVLCRDGELVILDFYRPVGRLFRTLFLGYLQLMGSVYGWFWHRSPVVYGYIARSIAHFVSVDDFAGLLRDAGFDVVEVDRRLFGGIALIRARKN